LTDSAGYNAPQFAFDPVSKGGNRSTHKNIARYTARYLKKRLHVDVLRLLHALISPAIA
jgi:hypothetical protein